STRGAPGREKGAGGLPGRACGRWHRGCSDSSRTQRQLNGGRAMNSHSKTKRTTRGFGRNTIGAMAVALAILAGSFAAATNAHAENCSYQGCFYRFPNGKLFYHNAQTWVFDSWTTYRGVCLYSGNVRYGCIVPHVSGRTGYLFVAASGKNFYLSPAYD